MTEMADRMARAIKDLFDERCDGSLTLGEALMLTKRALLVMYEPSEEQLSAYCDPRNEAMKEAVAAEWRGMVWVALHGQTHPPSPALSLER